MSISVFDLFSIGIGPSSSHTVGPMRAAYRFVEKLKHLPIWQDVARLRIDLYGSLALTGKGHGTDFAVILGLSGWLPESVDPDQIPLILQKIRDSQQLSLGGAYSIGFKEDRDLVFHYHEVLAHHANGLRLTAWGKDEQQSVSREYYSIGGGFVLDECEILADQTRSNESPHSSQSSHSSGSDEYSDYSENLEDSAPKNSFEKRGLGWIPYPFDTAERLLEHCKKTGFSIARIMMENEKTWRSEADIRAGLLKIWDVMSACIDHGCAHSGILPGGLRVKRRAPILWEKLKSAERFDEMNWLNLFALAVNEENAAGGRVVTAPTNGAAGIIPAVLRYHVQFQNGSHDSIVEFMLTAGAIGILFKLGASISAAEVGCQGEVGVACSMAAGALCAVMGGTYLHVENAAEIGMEHHLGLTCDPIGGLVQIPCIERNTMGTIQAVNAAKLALMGDGEHIVSLDSVIKTMRDTGHDMMAKYKETALGGLAINAKISVSAPAC